MGAVSVCTALVWRTEDTIYLQQKAHVRAVGTQRTTAAAPGGVLSNHLNVSVALGGRHNMAARTNAV